MIPQIDFFYPFLGESRTPWIAFEIYLPLDISKTNKKQTIEALQYFKIECLN